MIRKDFLRNNTVIGTALALAAFVVYLQTLAPSVDFIDSGELATVATTLGIAHPTGYPLFTLVGWVFAHLPLGLRVIYKLNLMAALLCAAAAFLYYRLFLFLLSDDLKKAFTGKTVISDLMAVRSSRVASAVAALILAFSETYWSQALSIEVYSLHILLLALTLLLFTRAMTDRLNGNNRATTWYAFALVLGLSFTNHMTTILLAPGFLYLYFKTHGFSADSWKKIAMAAIPFLIGFSVYLYLPVRASQNPVLNWGNPVTLERFLWHFSGKQYRVWIFSSFDAASKQFRYFLDSFPFEFAYFPIVLALVGVVHLFKNIRTVFWYTVLLFLGCLLYSINYDIHDIDSYFLLAYVVTAVWIAYGAAVALEFARRRRQLNLAYGTFLLFVVLSVSFHYSSVDESRNYAVEDYTNNMFASLDSNAVLLSFQWDYFLSASYYYQLVEGVRTDVTVIDKELLRRSWYLKELEHRYPWLIQQSRAEVDAFLQELYKFEHGLPYNSALIQARFEAMIHSFLATSLETRPVYATVEVEPEFLRGFEKIPSGLAFRLTRDSTYRPVRPVEFVFRPFPKTNRYVEGIKGLYATSYTNEAIQLALAGRRDEAVEFLRKALAVKGDYRDAGVWLQRLSATP